MMRPPALPNAGAAAVAILIVVLGYSLPEGAAMASTAFDRFRFSFLEDKNSAREGLDIADLVQLSGDERVKAEDMLIAFLPDTRAVIGLGELHSKRAEPKLEALFDAERLALRASAAGLTPDIRSPDEMSYLTKALWQIRPDSRRIDGAIDVLGHADEWVWRHTAAEALSVVCHPSAVVALTKALDDSEGLVRYQAALGLLAIHGLPAPPVEPKNMVYRVMSADAATQEGGKHDILAAIAGRPLCAS